MNKYKIERVTKEKYTDKKWQKYFEFRTVCAKKKKSKLHLKTWEELKDEAYGYLKRGMGIYTIKKNGMEAGHFYFGLRDKNKKKKRFVYLTHHFINKSIDNTLLKLIVKEFLKYDNNAHFLAIPSRNGDHDYIGKRLKADIGTNQIHLELKKKDVKKKVINKWVKTYSKKFPDLTMKFYEDIPDELLKEYCKVFTELLVNMPANSELSDHNVRPAAIRRWDKHDKKNNRTSYRYLVFNKDNKLIAKTNVALNKDKPQSMHQYMTGVLKEYREQGIGKWMKGVMYLKLEKDFPDYEVIKTETHPENHGSKSISLQMGYKQVATLKEFKVSREKSEAFLKK
ncbi:MAG: hypothetical protein GQ534_04425 [Candidatus Delongbacteria bacterium]|nr:hypothetical protein [Candidatus Delongbacteria bacterium]